jgi:hypothetical protein
MRRKMRTDAMQEKRVVVNGAQDRHPDWATLITEAVDEVTRILRSEAELIRISLGAALKAEVKYALATLAMAGALICAGVCALAALIVFLHQSHPDLDWPGLAWWQSFGIGAILMVVVALIIRSIAGRGPEVKIET